MNLHWLVRNVIRLRAEGKPEFLEKVAEAARTSRNALAYAHCIRELKSFGIDLKANPKYNHGLDERGDLYWKEYVEASRQSLEDDSRRNFLRYSALVRLAEETGVDVDNPYEDTKTKIGIAKRALGRGFFRGLNPKNPRQQERIGLVFKNLYYFARRVVRRG